MTSVLRRKPPPHVFLQLRGCCILERFSWMDEGSGVVTPPGNSLVSSRKQQQLLYGIAVTWLAGLKTWGNQYRGPSKRGKKNGALLPPLPTPQAPNTHTYANNHRIFPQSLFFFFYFLLLQVFLECPKYKSFLPPRRTSPVKTVFTVLDFQQLEQPSTLT